MLRVTFTEQDIVSLDTARRTHASSIVRRRAEALYLKAKGLRHSDIQRLCAITRTTLASYLHAFGEGGVVRVTSVQHRGQPSALNAYRVQLEAQFRAHPPQTVTQARALIREQTGLERSPTQIRAFLRRIGMKLRQTATLPARANEPDKQLEQETFEHQQLQPRLAEVRQGTRSLFS